MQRDSDRFILQAITVGLAIILLWLVVLKFALPKPEIFVQKTGGGFQLLVGGKPYLIKGIVYQPVPIGQSHQYNFWGDPNKPWIEDGRLMREMGANTVRFFQPGPDAAEVKQLIGELYQSYGIRTIMGHWMDYWRPGNYADAQYRQALTKRVLEMVQTYKDEPGILIWVLGNENNLSWHSGARMPWSCPEVEEIQDPYKQKLAKAKIYYSLVNQIARKIKKIDPKHPVALGNADSFTLEIAKEACPNVDLVALNVYRGKNFGNIWREVRLKINKPVLIMEFGCDSFNAKDGREDQEIQAVFLNSQWEDIVVNTFGNGCASNSLGGCVFEWNDEWWKHDEYQVSSWYEHDTQGEWSSGAYYFDIGAPNNMNMNEEWWGVVALSPELKNGINKRLPRKAYYELQQLWKNNE